MPRTVFIFDQQQCHTVDQPDFEQLLASNQVFWVDIYHPDPSDVALMRDVFKFHPLAIEDTLNQETRAKVEEYAEYLFAIISPIRIVDGELEIHEIDVFMGKQYVISVHLGAEASIADATIRIKDPLRMLHISSGYIFYTLLDTVVDGYLPLLEQISDDIETIEDEVTAQPTQRMLAELMRLKRALRNIVRAAYPMQSVINYISHHDQHFTARETLGYYFRDVNDHLMRVVEIASNMRETLGGVLDLYMSSTSNRLNKVVNRLTVITIAIGILSVFVGFYGMNFTTTFPAYADPNGVLLVIALMIVTEAMVLAFFRWRKWL